MDVLTALLLLVMADRLPGGSGDYTRMVTLNGHERSYLLHVPPQYDPMTPLPVVLAFHGGGANAATMVTFSGLNETADKAGFIVAYPDGSGRLPRMLTFNAGNCCGQAAAGNVDDVEFTRRGDTRHLRQRHDVGVFPAAPLK
jgi:polyhydroxybutyrate depolymerase